MNENYHTSIHVWRLQVSEWILRKCHLKMYCNRSWGVSLQYGCPNVVVQHILKSHSERTRSKITRWDQIIRPLTPLHLQLPSRHCRLTLLSWPVVGLVKMLHQSPIALRLPSMIFYMNLPTNLHVKMIPSLASHGATLGTSHDPPLEIVNNVANDNILILAFEVVFNVESALKTGEGATTVNDAPNVKHGNCHETLELKTKMWSPEKWNPAWRILSQTNFRPWSKSVWKSYYARRSRTHKAASQQLCIMSFSRFSWTCCIIKSFEKHWTPTLRNSSIPIQHLISCQKWLMTYSLFIAPLQNSWDAKQTPSRNIINSVQH